MTTGENVVRRCGLGGLAVYLALASAAAAPVGPASTNAMAPEAVILLHGLARTSRSMDRMEAALQLAGYAVTSPDYPSRQKPVEALAREDLAAIIAACQSNRPPRIHFVAHSLGGILVRQYLAENAVTNLGRIVMLGPPNQGSEVVDKLHSLTLFQWINGPAGQQLGTGTNAVVNRLPVPPTDVGVVAGTRSINWILSTFIPGPDDGKVAVGRTKLPGLADFETVPTSHPFLMQDTNVIAMTIRFLREGRFDR